MKHFLVLLLMALLAVVPAARAEGPDDEYVVIYGLIQQGDAYHEKGMWQAAITKYTDAQNALKRFQINYPDTYTKVIKFRLNYLATKIAEISSEPHTNAPPAVAPTTPATNAPSVEPQKTEPTNTPAVTPAPQPAPAPPAGPSTADLENQVKTLQEQLRRADADRSTLEAKLKEALSALPAAVDPKELTKAQDQIATLQKENDELKSALASSKTNAPAAKTSTAELEKSQAALAEANRKITALAEVNATLSQEKEVLQTRVKTLTAPDSSTAALREENDLLKKQLADLKSKTPTDANDAASQKLKEAQTQLAALHSDNEILRLEKIALETKVKQMVASPAKVNNAMTAAPETLDSVTAAKIAQLEAQRDEMKKTLDAVSRETQGRKKGAALSARMDDMTRQLAALHARIEVLEAHPIPYTDEELAMFSQRTTTLAVSAHSSSFKIASKKLSAENAEKLSEGQRFFAAGDLEKAEAKYSEVLKSDDKNIKVLSGLATIQLAAGHLDAAEKNVKAALAVAPDDNYCLLVLGKLKCQQKNYDEAFDALSRAAQLDPQNPEVQNFLGVALSEKGVRGPAETAFRRAIQLDPGYADAHINLAVVYATQQPPLIAQARWHYQKALAAGHPPSPAVEKLINPTRTAEVGH